MDGHVQLNKGITLNLIWSINANLSFDIYLMNKWALLAHLSILWWRFVWSSCHFRFADPSILSPHLTHECPEATWSSGFVKAPPDGQSFSITPYTGVGDEACGAGVINWPKTTPIWVVCCWFCFRTVIPGFVTHATGVQVITVLFQSLHHKTT